MPRLKATDEIHLTDRQKLVLHQLTRQQTAEQRLVVRAKILLLADENQSHSSIANRLHLKRATVIKWRRRWNEHTEKLKALAEESDEKRYTKQLMNPMGSAPRTGAPITFEAERVCQILVVACQPPEGADGPMTHWSVRELRDEVVKRGIVPQISARTVGRLLKSGGIKTPPNRKLGPTPYHGYRDLQPTGW